MSFLKLLYSLRSKPTHLICCILQKKKEKEDHSSSTVFREKLMSEPWGLQQASLLTAPAWHSLPAAQDPIPAPTAPHSPALPGYGSCWARPTCGPTVQPRPVPVPREVPDGQGWGCPGASLAARPCPGGAPGEHPADSSTKTGNSPSCSSRRPSEMSLMHIHTKLNQINPTNADFMIIIYASQPSNFWGFVSSFQVSFCIVT